MTNSRTVINNMFFRIIIGLLLLVLSGFYLVFSMPYWNNQIFWKDIEVKDMKISKNGPTYTLNRGVLSDGHSAINLGFTLDPIALYNHDQIIRLALFVQIQREDPLYSGPGLSVPNYRKSVERLEAAQQETLKNTDTGNNFLPVNYLKDTVLVNERLEMLNTNATLASAKSLIAAYGQTNDDYQKESKSLMGVLDQIEKKDVTYVQTGSATNHEIIYSDLVKIQNNSSLIMKIISDRSSCLSVSTIFCKRALGQEKLPNVDIGPQDVKTLSTKELYYYKDPSELKLRGPYAIDTICWTKKDEGKKTKYLYETEELNGTEKRLAPKLADTNYYKDMSGGTDILDLVYKKHDTGWRAVYETMPYACNDLEYQPTLATIDAFVANKDKLLGKTMETSGAQNLPRDIQKSVQAATNAENAFYESQYPSESALRALGIAYQNLYRLMVMHQNQRQGDVAPALWEIKNELLTRALFIDRKFANFDAILNYLSFSLDGYSQTNILNTKSSTSGKDNYLYLIRNGYSLTYLGFSPSVYKLKEALVYVDRSKDQLASYTVTYQEMLSRFGKNFVADINAIRRDQIWVEMVGRKIDNLVTDTPNP